MNNMHFKTRYQNFLVDNTSDQLQLKLLSQSVILTFKYSQLMVGGLGSALTWILTRNKKEFIFHSYFKHSCKWI